ncbi:MAG: ABC-F family ATP-binding cassette domain-containing protein [Victivallaceae bacterium]|nr:ABC-F family ATP-binding cassette domain-containing protein [Victivallaceae bacterium]
MAQDTTKTIFSGKDLSLHIGKQILLDNATISIFEGERIALVGRNGCGKSTFLKILAGREKAPQGALAFVRDLRVSYLPQEFSINENDTVYENVSAGMKWFEGLLQQYENSPHNSRAHELAEIEINKHNAWDLEYKISSVMERLNVPERDRKCADLSGGEKRRTALAAAVVGEPDLLLLDEPTNHLDTDTVIWIENFLASYRGTCMFVTHDRYFLDRVATRIVELVNGQFYSYQGGYSDFIVAKAEREHAEDEEEARRQSFLRSEVEWVRRSPKARLKRNMGRVKRFDAIADSDAPARDRDINLIIPPASRLGNKTVELKNISLAFGDNVLFSDFNHEFIPGSRTGIVGPNGCGKTSLLKLITGQLQPSSGTIETAATIQFNYIDQNRITLNLQNTVFEEIGEGNQTTQVGDQRISVWTYLNRFLFSNETINTRIDRLSGGERARLMLAKILKKGGNFLILDEPTNDLDLPTLRLLEEALTCYQGCVVVVSHDRYFLNRVCNSIIAMDGNGGIVAGIGDYDYYLNRRVDETPAPEITKESKPTEPEPPTQEVTRKLTWKEQRELDGMEKKIGKVEKNITRLENIFIATDFFEKHGDQTAELTAELDASKSELDQLFERWQELEDIESKD